MIFQGQMERHLPKGGLERWTSNKTPGNQKLAVARRGDLLRACFVRIMLQVRGIPTSNLVEIGCFGYCSQEPGSALLRPADARCGGLNGEHLTRSWPVARHAGR